MSVKLPVCRQDRDWETMTDASWDLYICQVPDGMDLPQTDSIIVDDNEALNIQRTERMEYIKQFENFKKNI